MAERNSSPEPRGVIDILKNEGFLALFLTFFTITGGIILSEVQNKVGWGPLLVSLGFVITLIVILTVAMRKPLETKIQYSFGEINSDLRFQLLQINNYRSQSDVNWLFDTEQLAEYESLCDADEIWLLTSDLLDDSTGGPFQDVVKTNVAKGTKYVFFVPSTPEIKARIESLRANHSYHKQVEFIFLPDQFFFLVPKLDIVIYNPIPKGAKERIGVMGLPVPNEPGHFHARISDDFIDKLVGTILESSPYSPESPSKAPKALGAAPAIVELDGSPKSRSRTKR